SSPADAELVGGADAIEIRTDLIDSPSEILSLPALKGMAAVVTLRGDSDLSLLPKGFSGFVDVGERPRPSTVATVIASYHDHDGTPSSDDIVSRVEGLDGDIVKGAFRVNTFSDLRSIFLASEAIERKHVLLGMGELGAVTRLRGDKLGNELTFAYVGEPTAPGQLSLEEMSRLGDGCIITGLLGHPISKSLSPKMHNAAYKASGLKGIFLKFDSESADDIEEVVREYGIKGFNVTIPFKESIIGHLDEVDKDAESMGAVNTVVNDGGVLKGYNTDVVGIEKAMANNGVDLKGMKAILIGSGGGARGCAYAMKRSGSLVTVTGRNVDSAMKLSKDLGVECMPKNSVAVDRYDVIVNCTPVGMYEDSYYPISLCGMSGRQVVMDMAYGAKTPIISQAESVGAKAIPGEEMLAAQGSEAFRLWTGVDQYEVMRKAVLG
ncbi:MAG: shikimate dehydrogenase, partial [Candidatus Methanoplasma sp.]|nr:shikimate dehydrogenase [Candidatus Methanoplasma sp.]